MNYNPKCKTTGLALCRSFE